MKPTLQLEDGKTCASPQTLQTEMDSEKGKSSVRKTFVMAAIFVSVALIVAGVVIGCIYIGLYMKTDLKANAQETNKASLVSSSLLHRDEVFDTPSMHIVRDFELELIVFKKPGSKTCFVSNFTGSQSLSEMNCNKTEHVSEDRTMNYISTGSDVSRDLLSPSGRSMCVDSDIKWVTREDNSGGSENGRFARSAPADKGCCCCCCCCCKCEVKSA